MNYEPGKCAYCGEAKKLTKEHIYGQWLKAYQPSSYISDSTVHTISTATMDQPVSVDKGKLTRQGPPASHQLKIACEDCNRIHLSAIQNEVKDVLIPLISGNWDHLTVDNIKILAQWMAMVTMTAEFDHPSTMAITKEHRREFVASRTIPENMQIYIGRTSHIGWGEAHHRGAQIIDDEDSPPTTPCPNVCTRDARLGNLFFKVIYAPLDRLPDSAKHAHDLGVRCIWPLPDVRQNPPGTSPGRGSSGVQSLFWEQQGHGRPPHFGLPVHDIIAEKIEAKKAHYLNQSQAKAKD